MITHHQPDQRRRGTLLSALALSLVLALLGACGGSDGGDGGPTPPDPDSQDQNDNNDGDNNDGDDEPDPPSFDVEQSFAPTTEEINGFDDGEPRPLAAVYDHEIDVATHFVANELVVVTNDEQALNELVDELEAEQLASFDPSTIGVDEAPTEYLLRVDPSGTDTDRLPSLLDELDEEAEGEFSAGSDGALQLLTLAAEQRTEGYRVSPNWVGQRSTFTDGTSLESPDGTDDADWSQNVFDWPAFGRDTTQNIDVVTAWQMLERTVDADSGSDITLTPGSIKIGILDGGFSPDDDFIPNGFLLPFWTAVNPLGFDPIETENLSTCTGGNPCPWHGTKVASAALAVPDNEYGSAGPAGPIADPLLLTTQVDRFSTLLSFEEAVYREADILNMSYSMWGPRFWAKSVNLRGDFDAYTQSLRDQGILLFASMPNNGRDYGSPPVRTFHIAPCYNAGVICVNGIAWDSTMRDDRSSWGRGIDISAPFTLWVGPTPGTPEVHGASGNSYASPFTAGVAALIMHANPELSADEVEAILLDTAHESPDPQIPRYVNAAGAVREALVQSGYEPISIDILNPSEGDTIERGTGINLVSDALDLDDGVPTVEWRRGESELLGEGETVSLGPDAFPSAGDYTLTATATGSNGSASDTVNITVTEPAPSMEITTPADGASFTRDESVALSGTSFSTAEADSLPDEDVGWFLGSADLPFATGHSATLDASTLSLGMHEIRFQGAIDGATGQDEISIEVVEPTPDPFPSVEITSPDNGASMTADQQDSSGDWYIEVTLEGDVSDNEPLATEDIVWTTSIDGGPTQTLGTGATVNDARLDAPECFGNEHEITLTATDSEGQTRSYSITVTVSILC